MYSTQGTDSPYGIVAVIAAAGSGTRMGSAKAKQFLELAGRPLLAVTLGQFQKCNAIDAIVLVVSESDIGYCLTEIVDKFGFGKVAQVVAGGENRQDSIRKGIEAVGTTCKWVLIHDGARPFVTSDLIERVTAAARSSRAVITGLPVKDTVKEVDSGGRVLRSVERSRLWLIQTPQIFRREDIHLAHQTALVQGWESATDDAFLIEKMGIPVTVIEGEEQNIKVTTPQDLQIARYLMSRKSQ